MCFCAPAPAAIVLLLSLFAINLKEMKRREKTKYTSVMHVAVESFFLVLFRNERISSKISVNDINNMISTILSIVCSLVNDFTQLRGFVCVCVCIYTLFVGRTTLTTTTAAERVFTFNINRFNDFHMFVNFRIEPVQYKANMGQERAHTQMHTHSTQMIAFIFRNRKHLRYAISF